MAPPPKGHGSDNLSSSSDTSPSNETARRLSEAGNPTDARNGGRQTRASGKAEDDSLVRRKVLPHAGAVLSLDATTDGKQTGRQSHSKKIFTDLQDSLISTASAVYRIKETEGQRGSESKSQATVNDEIKQLEAALKEEQEARVFGPKSKQAYKDYLQWLQAGRVPEIIALLKKVRPESYEQLVQGCEQFRDLKIDPNKIPGDAEVKKLIAAYGVLADSVYTVDKTRNEFVVREFDKIVESNPAYAGWKRKPGEDPDAWRVAIADNYDLAATSRNYAQAMVSYYQASKNKDFPLALPAGTTIVAEANGVTKNITDKELSDPSVRSFLADAKVKEVVLSLPRSLNQGDADDKQRKDTLRNWLTDYGKVIDKAHAQLTKNPDTCIMFADQEIRNGKGRFDDDGKFLGLADPKRYTPKAGETLRDLNLVGYDFNVTEIKEGKDAGKFKITQTIRAEKAPPLAYLNARFLGVKKVGEDMAVAEQIVGADDFVRVSNGGKPQLQKVGEGAKDLQAFKTEQQLAYYGPKVIDAGLNVAMAATATIEIGAILKGAEVAALGLTLTEEQIAAGLALSGRQAALQGGLAGLRLSAAVAGIGNNAGAKETQLGQDVEVARRTVFLLDILGGTSRAAAGLVSTGEQTRAALSTGQKIQTIINGRKAANGVEALEPWSGAVQVHEFGSKIFRGAEAYFGVDLPVEIVKVIGEIKHGNDKDPASEGSKHRGDGRDSQLGRVESFDPAKAKSLEGVGALLDNYSTTLHEGRSAEVAEQVKKIFDTTKDLLRTQSNEQDRVANEQSKQKYREELLSKIAFTPAEIKDLERAHPDSRNIAGFQFTEQRLKDLMNPEKAGSFPKPVQAVAEKILQARDKDVLAATHIALLYLSKDQDIQGGGELARRTFEIPAYSRGEMAAGPYSYPLETKRRTDSFSISAKEAVQYLERDLASPNLGNRGIIVGDALTRLGASTPQEYADVLQKILTNPSGTKPEDRMRALTSAFGGRFASVFESIHKQEVDQKKTDISVAERERSQGRLFGVSTQSLLTILENTAKNDTDANVKAMAAGLVYALNEPDAGRRTELAKGYSDKWNSGNREKFAEQVRESLKSEAERKVGRIVVKDPAEYGKAEEVVIQKQQSKFSAAQALALITDPKDAPEQFKVTLAMARCLSGASAETVGKIIDTLVPERLEAIAKADAKAADELRAYCLRYLSPPHNAKEETDVLKLIGDMQPLLKDGAPELKKKLGEGLDFLLRDSADYPKVRIAAIETLSQLGSRDGLPRIRNHVAAASFKVGDHTIFAHEADGNVRAAAIKAAASFQDADLNLALNKLIEKESDPRAILALRDARSQQHERNYSNARNDGQSDSKDVGKFSVAIDYERYPYLKDFGHKERLQWLRENFSILDPDNFAKTCNEAALNATGIYDRWTSWSGETQAAEQSKVFEIQNLRIEKFQELCRMAECVEIGGDEEKANKAKLALLEIMSYPETLGNEGHTIQVKGNQLDTKLYNHDWSYLAAKAFKEMAGTGARNRDLTGYCIKIGMTDAPLVPGQATMELRDGLSRLGQRSVDGRISQEEIDQTTVEGLRLELGRPASQQSDYLQLSYLHDLRDNRYKPAQLLIDIIADRSSIESVRREATSIANNFRDLVTRSWNETIADSTATAEERAYTVRNAIESQASPEIVVKRIFEAYKGYTLKDQNDPGVPELRTAMQVQNDQIQLAAATAILQSKLPVDNAVRHKVVEVLKNLSTNGNTYESKKRAGEMLASLSQS